ncbi:hypothetical protein MLD38_002577 [Melastoma candidum]|uniref:Uncharacterized protein n=1 Tax=Melastoma candidum TaxID=119954 RepID=A0ACB9S1A9_9MYRT|nr:hypothetical protein MLD38_002577 [Melastoma candidum]
MESHHVAAGSRGFGRWGSAEFRRPPGHRKQGGWHMFPEEPGHGYIPSRSTDQLMEEETGRRSSFRVDGKYNRIYRDHGASFGQRDWKGGNSWEDGNGRPIDVCSSQRSVDGFPHTSSRHIFPDEPGHSYMRSRSADKLVDEENGRRSTFRGDGKYSRNYRDNRASFGQRDWKGPNSWENSNGRPVDVLPQATCRPVLVEDPSHCYMPSRSAEKLMEEDSGRRSTFRENGKYNRSYRENKGSFGHRVWKGADTWETNSGRPVDVGNSQRSVDELTHTSSRHEQVEESGHGYIPSRSTDKLVDEEGGRRSTYRVDGKYNRNYRDNRGPFRQKYSKDAKSLENGSSKPTDVNEDQKPVEGLPHISVPQSDCGNACESLPGDTKEHEDVSNDGNASSTGQKCEKDSSLTMMDWKPLKWSRSGSLSSRGSGLSHSSSSKSLGGMNSGEAKGGIVAKDDTPVTSPTGDAVACVTSGAPVEEMNSKKKPRLGWGEGLAKYEKKKVEGVDEDVPKQCELLHSVGGPSLASKSPMVTGVLECASPATPSSVGYSSSPGLEEKSFPKNSSGHSEFIDICPSPAPRKHDLFEGFSFHLENMDASSIANLGFSLIEMLQSDDPLLAESGFMRSPALKKAVFMEKRCGEST